MNRIDGIDGIDKIVTIISESSSTKNNTNYKEKQFIDGIKMSCFITVFTHTKKCSQPKNNIDRCPK